ncbi:hypothetical protein MVEG_04273 [Podila verticillata NRRL 6337]|nr:hypothetical protein MVEG_04273 [Podila verticillata NRRL 6337]
MRNKDLNRANNIGATTDPSTPPDQSPPLPTLPPEIHHMIIAHLDQGTLASCTRVSKTFRHFSTPFFWRVVDISSTENLIRFLRECTQKALAANAEYIQELTLFHRELCAIFIPARQSPSAVSSFYDPESLYTLNSVYCTQLRKLWIWCRPPPEEWHKTTQCQVEYEEIEFTEDMAQDCVALVRRNPNLRSLKIDQQLPTSTFLDLALDSAPALQELDFLSDVDRTSFINSIQFETIRFILEHLPEHIKEFSIVGMEEEDSLFGEMPVRTSPKPMNHHALESLTIRGRFEGQEEHLLLPFLTTCSTNLKHFNVYDINCYRIPRINHVLRQLGVDLETLDSKTFPRFFHTTDRALGETIALSPRLKHLNLKGFGKAGPHTAAATLTICHRLESFNLVNAGSIPSWALQSILSRAKNIREFETIEHIMWSPPSFLSASHMLGSEWPTLEKFSCPIWVPRPNCDVKQERQDATLDGPTPEYCLGVQRYAYKQLASQTQLRELRLRYNADSNLVDKGFQWFCLEMTLESGLGELEGLKNLEELDVRNMNHKIRVDDFLWMRKNWPKLKRIHGLCERGNITSHVVLKACYGVMFPE